MANILITPDIMGWAIGNITESIVKKCGRLNFYVVPVHPRGVGDAYQKIRDLLDGEKIDLWHAQYWRSAQQLWDLFPKLREIPSVLSHYNHESLTKDDWSRFTTLTAPTKWSAFELK